MAPDLDSNTAASLVAELAATSAQLRAMERRLSSIESKLDATLQRDHAAEIRCSQTHGQVAQDLARLQDRHSTVVELQARGFSELRDRQSRMDDRLALLERAAQAAGGARGAVEWILRYAPTLMAGATALYVFVGR